MALLATQGIRSRPSLRNWERDLASLETGNGRKLPPCLAAEVHRLRLPAAPGTAGNSSVPPERDTGVALVLPEATVPAMQALIDELAGQLPADRHAVLVMERAGWHIAAKLTWPETITPLHLLSYSPELNPSERVWLYLRERFLSHRLFDTVDAILDACCDAWNALLAETGRVASLGLRLSMTGQSFEETV